MNPQVQSGPSDTGNIGVQPCRVGLIQINNSFSGQNYLPYAVGLIEGYVRKFATVPGRFEFLLPVYKRQRVVEAVEQLVDADIVGFSTYVWNVKLSLAVARELKARKPGILIVFGGPQVPDRTEPFLRENPFIDVAINGEGEHAFTKILDCWPSRDWSGIANLSFVRDGKFICQAKGPRIRDLNDVPSPYLEGIFEPLMAANPKENWIVLWETNRGCPFQCTFCDWGSATQAKVFQFDLPRLDREIAWFADKKIEFIFCCDANFGILARDIQLAESLARTKAERGYPRAISVQNTKNATDRAYLTQKILSDAGMNKGVTLSMQSLDPGTLKAIKRQNIALDTYEELQRRFTRDRVETYSDLILGLPGETYDSWVDGICWLMDNGQHNRIQFNNLSILPNAEMGDPAYQEKFGMRTVVTRIVNIHGTIDIDPDGIYETQDLVVETGINASRRLAACAKLRVDDGPHPLQQAAADPDSRRAREVWRAVPPSAGGVLYRRCGRLSGDRFDPCFLRRLCPPDPGRRRRVCVLGEVAGASTGRPTSTSSSISWKAAGSMLSTPKPSGSSSRRYQSTARWYRAIRSRTPSVSTARWSRGRAFLPTSRSVSAATSIPIIARSWKDAARTSTKRRWSIASSVRRSLGPSSTDWCREVVWYGNKKGAYLYGNKALAKHLAGHF